MWDGQRELLALPTPLAPVQLRALGAARSNLGSRAPSAAYRPAADHPWRPAAITKTASSSDRITEQMN